MYARAEVHFPSDQTVSVQLRTDELFPELVLLSAYFVRQMHNLGSMGGSLMLAPLRRFLELPDNELFRPDKAALYATAPLLLAKPASGTKHFIAELSDSNFQLKFKGFGWFGSGIEPFAGNSAVALFRQIGIRHLGKAQHIAALRHIGKCVKQLSASNCGPAQQLPLSGMIVGEAMAEAGIEV